MIVLSFTVPLVPPTVNHYVRHTRKGEHYLTRAAKAFKDAVAICAAGRSIDDDAKRVQVAISIYLGRGDRGDIDNYPKCVLDGLKGTVIKSDAMVKCLLVTLERDAANPRTVIGLWRLDKRKEEKVKRK